MKLLFILLFYILSLEAQFTFNAQSMHNGNIYTLENKDIVFSGDSIKFSFSSNKNEKVEIYYDNKGSLEKIYSVMLEQNKQYGFPNENNWLKLDNNTGNEKFIFKLSNEEKVFQLEHVPLFSTINQDQIKSKNLLLKNSFEKLDQRLFINLADVKSNSRGKTEIRVFKELSAPVVLIKSDEEIGTGVLISKYGEILTNWHVIKDKSNVLVAFKPKTTGRKPCQRRIILCVFPG